MAALSTVSILVAQYHAFLFLIHETGFKFVAYKLNFENDSQTNKLAVMSWSQPTFSHMSKNGLEADV